MTAPTLDRLQEEIAETIRESYPNLGVISSAAFGGLAIDTITRHIPADVLAGLLDGTMVAVPVEPTEAMLIAAGDAFYDAIVGHVSGDLENVNRPFRRFYRAMLAAAKRELSK